VYLGRRHITLVILVCSVFIAGASNPTCDPSRCPLSVSDLNDRDIEEQMERWEKKRAVEDIFRKAMRQPKSPVPIIYDDRLSPWPLTQAQANRVMRRAAEVCPKGHEAWFVRVRNNYVYDWEMHAAAIIYFAPYETTPRIRKGWRAGYSDLFRQFRRPLGKRGQDAKRKGRRSRRPPRWEYPSVSEYWQVSLPDKPFGEHLEVPTKTLWPFEPPRGFTEQEVIAIVDFIRTSPKQEVRGDAEGDRTGSITIPILRQVDGQLPILSIERSPAGIVVETGTVQGMLAGSGESVLLRRKGGSFVVVSITMWVS